MKIRTGFVSNSSSSSFVLAFKKAATREEIKEAFYTQKDDILEFLQDNLDYLEISDTYTDVNEALEPFILDCVDTVVSYSKNGLTLDNWTVFGGTASNDTSNNFDALMYGININGDFFKIEFFD